MVNTLAFALLAAPAAAPAIPANLVGEWRWTSVSGTTYWDTRSSAYIGNGGGMSDTLVIAADGTYKEYAYIETSPNAGWTVKSYTTMRGKVEVEGDKIRFVVREGRFKGEDNQVASRNFERPMRPDEAEKRTKSTPFLVRMEKGKPVFVKLLGKEEMKYERVR